jgi:hypothetical protein
MRDDRAFPGAIGRLVSGLAWLTLGVAVAAAGQEPAAGDPPPPREREPAPQVGAEDSAALSQAVVELLRQAEGRLAQNRLDEETGRVHKDIVDGLDRLVKLMEQQTSRAMAVPFDQPQQGSSPQSSSTGGTGEQGPRRTDDASESSAATGRPNEPATDLERRANLPTSVWGHLPPRVRAEIENSYNERFLPKYDELVRRYYEALATQGGERR